MQHQIKALNLEEYCESFAQFFARPKEILLFGDAKLHLRFINALGEIVFTPPNPVINLQSQLALLKKFGFLKLDEIFEFVKIVRYFNYLKSLKCEGILGEWFDKIVIPAPLLEIAKNFNEQGDLRVGIYLELDSINAGIERIKKEIAESLVRILHQNKLQNYLVDRQIHLINGEECLLLRAGFHHLLKGQILNRSAAGFFYVFPQSIAQLKDKHNELNNQKESKLFEICREISSVFTKHFLFLQFINKEFDRFDSYQARLNFAKERDLEFLAPNPKTKNVILDSFKHPALKNPKSIRVELTRQVLMITGVNAGGKTMLLKSLLSAVFLSKHLIPMPINAAKSSIGSFKHLHLILEDPQNSKNDISTFGGRMLQFSHILRENDGIIGIDEIELGTDSDEAASLFKVLLENLMQKNNKIIITTHHKRLAALMAGNPQVQLLAALFDEKREMPTFSFLDGTIGKSYAFETALRYGIPKTLVKEAKILYGEDKEKLNALIENSARLEMKLQNEIALTQEKSRSLEQKILRLKGKEEQFEKDFVTRQNALESSYADAIRAAKNVIKAQTINEMHREMNVANALLQEAQKNVQQRTEAQKKRNFAVGNRVKYHNVRGVVLNLQKENALIELEEGIKMKVPIQELELSNALPKQAQTKIHIESPKGAHVTLDLHGLRAQEALERLDEFISNSLIAGFDEVLIYHGIGTGKLSSVVRDFLKSHPKVVDFSDAAPKDGGFGAKIVKL